MSRLPSQGRNGRSPRKTGREHPAAHAARDRLLVELELQQTRSDLQIEHLQKLQRELQSSRGRFEALYQNAPLGYITLNEKGLITEWNATAAGLLDPKKRGLFQSPFTFFAEREDTGIVLGHLVRCKRAEHGQVISELRLRCGGRQVPVQIVSVPFLSGGKRFFQTAVIDLTERKGNESAREEATELSDAIIQTIHEPLLLVDTNLRIVRVNEAFAKSFGVSKPLANSLSLETVLNLWWDGNQLRTKLEHALVKNLPLNNFEFEAHPRNLGRRVLLFNARVLRHRKDSPPLLLVALEDITARKEAEEELAKSNQELQHLNSELEKRVEERTKELRDSNKRLESFCYSIAHDLRSPLRTMAGFGTVLLNDFAPKLGARGSDLVERVVGAAQQMDRLIQDLLEFGKFNTIEFQPAPVEADELLSHVIQSMQPALRERRARIKRKGQLPRVMGHKVVLEAVFSNLLSNAIKFVPPDIRPEVMIWPENREQQVRVWVADNGIGIEPQYHQKIFEVFQRLHSQSEYPGTGIGLAIVQRAVQRIGGGVGVESEPGKGSRFWISLPRAG